MNNRVAKKLCVDAAFLTAYVGGLALAGTTAATLSVGLMQNVVAVIEPMRTAKWDEPKRARPVATPVATVDAAAAVNARLTFANSAIN